ncbi:MAG: hypothetical protein JWP01_3421 [Myxococcales bacterium]|nr:hypothetical protein [Myxococcales bacterium]
MRQRITAVIAIVVLAGLAWWLPQVRRSLTRAVVTFDAKAMDPAPLPGGGGPGLARVARTRVVLIDGLAAATARTLPAMSALCKTGATLDVEVGFPTVSLPVEVALWTGLTQQQTGVVYRSSRPLEPPLDRHGIPAQVPGSWAVAENYGYIVRSLGFARVEPAADPAKSSKDLEPAAWITQWQARALEAVKSAAPLAFIHILRVDTAGHKHGIDADYARVALEADAILATLHAADPTARWFVLSDHGHIATGGHGGEERHVRHVQGCIAGPGISPSRGSLVHIVDVSRAIADSVGATLDPASRGRPLSAALVNPLTEDQGVPPMALGSGALAIFVLVAGLAVSSLGVRRWWLVPWWFVIACGTLIAIRGLPSLSTPMIYKPEGRDMYLTWLPALVIAFLATWIGSRRTTLGRVLIAQLALPFAAAAAAITAAGAWPTVLGEPVAPVVPYFTAWMSPLILMAAHGSAAVALGVLATFVPRWFGRPEPAEPPRSEPAAG